MISMFKDASVREFFQRMSGPASMAGARVGAGFGAIRAVDREMKRRAEEKKPGNTTHPSRLRYMLGDVGLGAITGSLVGTTGAYATHRVKNQVVDAARKSVGAATDEVRSSVRPWLDKAIFKRKTAALVSALVAVVPEALHPGT